METEKKQQRDNRIIYEPSGPAREYSSLACNIYKGCQHGCVYCFGKNRKSPEQKHSMTLTQIPKTISLKSSDTRRPR